MQAVYKKSQFSTNIWSSLAGTNVPSTLWQYTSHCVDDPHAMSLCHASVKIAFITDAAANIIKIIQHIFAYNGLYGGYRPMTYIFYRATRMHSADYAVERCLSVCPSVTHR